MRKELTDLLYQRWPEIFTEHLRTQGSDAADTRSAPQYVATDVKEKFGELRFVARHKSAEQIGAVKMAYAMSTRICEECGAPGRHRCLAYK